MPEWPTNQYVEIRNGGYYVAGTRIGLDVVISDYRRGESAEQILESYPSIGSLAKVYGAILFVLEHADVIEEYLRDQERLWKELQEKYPMPEELLERFRRADAELAKKSA
ncbi:MAG TPA: DUF433 domain-containing protein [Bryobacteraceae bacterium]|jgi:uncharacterized protein (DUF433 family)|nr:DUF433 domain-containing protein [Bryobacteraceae bacterium]